MQFNKLFKSIVLLLIGTVISTTSSLVNAKLTGSLSEEAITKRLEPIGQVKVEAGDAHAARLDAAKAAAKGPAGIYKKNCMQCHKTGLAGAPKYGNRKDWATRLAKGGIDYIVETGWQGIGSMPPKGNCLKCSKEDFRATVQYILDSLE